MYFLKLWYFGAESHLRNSEVQCNEEDNERGHKRSEFMKLFQKGTNRFGCHFVISKGGPKPALGRLNGQTRQEDVAATGAGPRHSQRGRV